MYKNCHNDYVIDTEEQESYSDAIPFKGWLLFSTVLLISIFMSEDFHWN